MWISYKLLISNEGNSRDLDEVQGKGAKLRIRMKEMNGLIFVLVFAKIITFHGKGNKGLNVGRCLL